jgi:cyclic beta-1,2-glucan synthetase
LISSVDLGNFHICLICFSEYINELDFVDEKIKIQISEIIDGINYNVFINDFEEMSILVDKDGIKSEIYYNIWASETRIASFLAIATGAVLDRHWYSLERTQSFDGIYKSWGGGCFEYLLPAIFFKSNPESLEYYTYKKYIGLSIQESKKINPKFPWGQSESIYLDDDGTLKYGPVGVTKTCTFPNLSNYFIVAPYATTLCGSIEPLLVIENLKKIEKFGGRGEFGFFESMSFKGDRVIIAKKYMCHHQCMSIVSLTNMLTDGFVTKLFTGSKYGKLLEYLHNSNIAQTANISKTDL